MIQYSNSDIEINNHIWKPILNNLGIENAINNNIIQLCLHKCKFEIKNWNNLYNVKIHGVHDIKYERDGTSSKFHGLSIGLILGCHNKDKSRVHGNSAIMYNQLFDITHGFQM